MAHKYRVSLPAILMYYNIVGVDSRDIDINQIGEEVSELEYLSPGNQCYLTHSSERLDEAMQSFLRTMCTSFGYSIEDEQLKMQYYKAYMGIVNITTNLNLIPENSSNYKLHFERLNSILLVVLNSLNSMTIMEVIEFYELIKKNSLRGIMDWYKNYCELILITMLGMNNDSNIEDYKMFEENSSNIDDERLIGIFNGIKLGDNLKIKEHNFRRLSYRKSLELTK